MNSRIGFSFLLIWVFIVTSCNDQPSKVSKNLVQSKKIEMPEETKKIFPAWVSLDYIMGKYKAENHSDMVTIDTKYADQKGRIMHKEAYESFKKMHAKAKADGVTLIIKSALRNFDYQKGIWERKWNGSTLLEGKEHAPTVYKNPLDRALAILKFSSMPSSSRHHWGTDIDLNSFNNKYFESGEGLKEFTWLENNAAEFGFCRPYSQLGTDRESGYQEEKWHWSYRPISDVCTDFAKEKMKDAMFTGFEGSETATEIGVVENYILGISKSCKY